MGLSGEITKKMRLKMQKEIIVQMILSEKQAKKNNQ